MMKVKWRVIKKQNCIVERENAFFKSSSVDEYNLPQMNSEKFFLGVARKVKFGMLALPF
jgi:hypothetical protein